MSRAVICRVIQAPSILLCDEGTWRAPASPCTSAAHKVVSPARAVLLFSGVANWQPLPARRRCNSAPWTGPTPPNMAQRSLLPLVLQNPEWAPRAKLSGQCRVYGSVDPELEEGRMGKAVCDLSVGDGCGWASSIDLQRDARAACSEGYRAITGGGDSDMSRDLAPGPWSAQEARPKCSLRQEQAARNRSRSLFLVTNTGRVGMATRSAGEAARRGIRRDFPRQRSPRSGRDHTGLRRRTATPRATSVCHAASILDRTCSIDRSLSSVASRSLDPG